MSRLIIDEVSTFEDIVAAVVVVVIVVELLFPCIFTMPKSWLWSLFFYQSCVFFQVIANYVCPVCYLIFDFSFVRFKNSSCAYSSSSSFVYCIHSKCISVLNIKEKEPTQWNKDCIIKITSRILLFNNYKHHGIFQVIQKLQKILILLMISKSVCWFFDDWFREEEIWSFF